MNRSRDTTKIHKRESRNEPPPPPRRITTRRTKWDGVMRGRGGEGSLPSSRVPLLPFRMHLLQLGLSPAAQLAIQMENLSEE